MKMSVVQDYVLCLSAHLPPEVRDQVAQALSGHALVPVDQLRLESALSYGGLAVLRDA